MMREQMGGAFIAALLGQDVSISQIERAVKVCEELRIGASIIQAAILPIPPEPSYALSAYTHATWKRLEAL